MTGLFPVSLAVILLVAVFLMTARELSLYRADRRERSELYPYSRRRLVLRMFVSRCMTLEVFLLLLLPPILKVAAPPFLNGGRSGWFALYVGGVVVVALVMVVLAALDLRESRLLHVQSKERLYKEFLEELKRGARSPEVH